MYSGERGSPSFTQGSLHGTPKTRVVAFGAVNASALESQPGIEVLSATNIRALQESCAEVPYAVVVLNLERMDSAHRSDLIAAAGRSASCLAISTRELTESDYESLLREGLSGVLPFDYSPDLMLRAVRSVSSGQLWFPREIISRVLRGFLIEEDLRNLTTREVEILELIGTGLNNQQIADSLFISRETVRWHVRGLYSKLGIKDRQGAEEYVRYLSVCKKTSNSTVPKLRSLAS